MDDVVAARLEQEAYIRGVRDGMRAERAEAFERAERGEHSQVLSTTDRGCGCGCGQSSGFKSKQVPVSIARECGCGEAHGC